MLLLLERYSLPHLVLLRTGVARWLLLLLLGMIPCVLQELLVSWMRLTSWGHHWLPVWHTGSYGLTRMGLRVGCPSLGVSRGITTTMRTGRVPRLVVPGILLLWLLRHHLSPMLLLLVHHLLLLVERLLVGHVLRPAADCNCWWSVSRSCLVARMHIVLLLLLLIPHVMLLLRVHLLLLHARPLESIRNISRQRM